MSGNGKVKMTFKIFRGEQLLRTEQLAQDIIKVGKLPSSHLRIDDDNVSRMHAVIEVTGPDQIFIIDLGSAAGTVVNGKKINKCQLQSGDEILLGDTKVVVEVEAAAQPAAPAPGAVAPPPVAAPAVANPFAAPVASAPMANPFAVPAPTMGVEDPDNIAYGVVASGPPVVAEDVETSAQALEVVVMWGDQTVLHVEHMSPPRSFYVGEADSKGKLSKVDFLIGSEALGTDRMPVVVEVGGSVSVVIPQGATGGITVGEQVKSLEELQSGGQTQACSEMPGAQQYPLPPGAVARVEHRGLTFVVKQVQAGKKVAAGMGVEWRPFIYIGGSMAVHAVFLLMFYFLPPYPASLSLDLLSENSRLVEYLMEPPETEREDEVDWLQDQNSDDKEGGKGKRHKNEEGQMGKKESKKTRNKFGIEGPESNEDPHMARDEARDQARNAGILGTLSQMTGSWNAPTSPFGRDTALGNDPMSALGGLMGDAIGENFGFGGLGLRGTGRGGGGTGEGTIGLGNLGTIGHGAGGGSGSGYGRGAGGFSGRRALVPRIRTGRADVRGSLSKDVIRRVIRRHINEVRFCYEQELNQRPDLEGRVTVAFIISPTGAVQSSAVGVSTLGNARVENCIAGAVRRWNFPAPEGGGIVVVNYPFVLNTTGG